MELIMKFYIEYDSKGKYIGNKQPDSFIDFNHEYDCVGKYIGVTVTIQIGGSSLGVVLSETIVDKLSDYLKVGKYSYDSEPESETYGVLNESTKAQ